MSIQEEIFESKEDLIRLYLERDARDNTSLDIVKDQVKTELFSCDNSLFCNYISYEGKKQMTEQLREYMDLENRPNIFVPRIEVCTDELIEKFKLRKIEQQKIEEFTTIREIYEYLTLDQLNCLGY